MYVCMYQEDANLTFSAEIRKFRKFKIFSKIMEFVSASPMYISHLILSSEQYL